MGKTYSNVTYMHVEYVTTLPRKKLMIELYTEENSVEGIPISGINEITFKDNIKIEGMERVTRVSTIKLQRLPTTISFDIYPDKPVTVSISNNVAYISYGD